MIILRGRARRLVARSWTLSWFYYRLHGLPLAGRPGEHVWYFAYGANMHDRAFRERRRMRPVEQRVGRIRGYRLRFNIEGRPRGRSAPANLCPDAEAEVWGVLYRLTRRDLLRLDSTEGVPGRGYRPDGSPRRTPTAARSQPSRISPEGRRPTAPRRCAI